MNKSPKNQNKPCPGPGELYYLVGASGVGKDSLMQEICCQAHVQDNLMIAPRMVTRRNTQSEHDVELSEQAFKRQQAADQFLFAWQAHGFHYGIDKNILTRLGEGKSILVNGSRAYAEQARWVYPALVMVGIDADPQILKARLKARGREKKAEIEERLLRNAQYQRELQRADVVIQNHQALETVAASFLALIRSGK